mmetsp:Transcript_18018/g.36287  ORF Transcript_18018/g.36287 Transcript_18018/m.36287 type:complete len:141 (+) Transcript_18018:130-552(+)
MKQFTFIHLATFLLFVLSTTTFVQGSRHGHLITALISQGRIEQQQRLAFVPPEEVEDNAEEEESVAFVRQCVNQAPVAGARRSSTEKRRRKVVSPNIVNSMKVPAKADKDIATARRVRSECRFTGIPDAVGEYMMLNTGY